MCALMTHVKKLKIELCVENCANLFALYENLNMWPNMTYKKKQVQWKVFKEKCNNYISVKYFLKKDIWNN